MPRSGNPFFPVVNLMLVPFGLFTTFVGAAVLLSGEGGEIWWLYVAFLLSGVLMLWGAASNLVKWWRWQRDENAAAAAMAAATRAHAAPHSAEPYAPPASWEAPPAPATTHPAAPPASWETPAPPPAAHPAAPPTPSAAAAPVLAHWTYSPDEWSAYTRREVQYRRSEAFWIFVGTVVLGIVVLRWWEGTDWGTTLAVSLTIAALMGGGKWLIARSAQQRNVATPRGEVVISPTAILMNGSYQVIQDHHFRFRAARVIEGERPAILEIGIEWPTRSGTATEEYRIPIPAGREDEARAIAQELGYLRQIGDPRRVRG
ncbi:MAG: hypothetical protein ACJ8GN_24790 [Longimicrobiaceae bacterium]